MEPNPTISPDPPATPQAPGDIPAPALDYAPRPRAVRLRRWLRPGSAGFFGLVLALAVAGSWWGWKWRLRADEKAFNERATANAARRWINFTKPPNAASLRYLSRLAGTWRVFFNWKDDSDRFAPLVFRGRPLLNVTQLSIFSGVDADLWLKELSRPDSGLKAIIYIGLFNSKITEKTLKELARLDSGLKALEMLEFRGTRVTNAGVEALQKARPGLKIVR
jgi:hypothetical protein